MLKILIQTVILSYTPNVLVPQGTFCSSHFNAKCTEGTEICSASALLHLDPASGATGEVLHITEYFLPFYHITE